jgi:hypothetical protein
VGVLLIISGCLLCWTAFLLLDESALGGLLVGLFGIVCASGGCDLVVVHGARLGI